jgi:hypothetical protein
MLGSPLSAPSPLSRRARLIATLALSLVATRGFASSGVAATEPTTFACGLTQTDVEGLSGDAGTDIHAVSRYSDTIYGLFKAKKFKQIDCLADSVRGHKDTFAGGMWKIHTLYAGLEKPPLHPTHEDWVAYIAQMQDWVSRRPRSITAKIALAQSYVDYGWDARGTGLADTVSESGWKLLRARAGRAKLILQQASLPSVKDPEWYLVMQGVALAQGWEPEARKTLLAKAVKFEPTYYYYYRMYADSILPKWGGEDGEFAAFLQKAADEIGGDAGDILYFRVAGTEVCGCETDQKLNLSWPRIQKGFDAVEKQNGPSLENWNLMAHMAVSFGDVSTADKLFIRIGDQWSRDIWRDFAYFDSGKQWAKQIEAVNAKNRPAEEAAEANLKTPRGERYNSSFADKIRTWLQPCLDDVSSSDLGKFELLIKVGKEGTIDDIRGGGDSRLMPCLGRKINDYRTSKQVALPTPPEPDYWVRFDFGGNSSNSAALK